ncbi:MAG TPA: hypothetical protein VEF71_09805 [Streptosporangiaceae bacterium]|nr:hypothetical protein [Streptosporangiaceae bacterium]
MTKRFPYGLTEGRRSSAAPQNTSRPCPAGSSRRSMDVTRRAAASSAVPGLYATPASARARPTAPSAAASATSQPEASSRSRWPGRMTSRAGKSSIRRYAAPSPGPRPSVRPSTLTPNSRQAATSADSIRR